MIMKSPLLLLLGFAAAAVCQAQTITMTLKDVSIPVGSDAKIPCSFETTITSDINPQYRWYRATPGSLAQRIYGYQKGNEAFTGRSAGFQRALRYEDKGGVVSLIIPNTTLEDNKIFQGLSCEVEFGKLGVQQGSLKLVVYKEPVTKPKAKLTSPGPFDAGQKQQIGSCSTDFVFPEPVIEFYRDSVMVKSQDKLGTEMVAKHNPDDPLAAFVDPISKTRDPAGSPAISVTRQMYLNTSKADDMATFYCIVKSGDPAHPLVQNVTFDKFRVNYPTDKVIVAISPDGPYYVGQKITAKCKPNGFPDAVITDFHSQTSSELMLTVAKDTTEFSCTANNGHSDVTGSTTINVIYLDSAQISGAAEVAVDGTLTLTCSAMTNDQASVSYTWMKDGDTIGNEATFTKQKVMFGDKGRYTCTASNGHIPSLSAEANHDVAVNGVVAEQENGKVTMSEDKKSATLTCTVRASPKPAFVWTRDGVDQEISSTKETNSGNEYTSVLELSGLDSSYSEAKYTCKATSGNEFKDVSFRLEDIKEDPTSTEISKGSSPAVIIIVIVVILLLIAIVLAVLYNKGIICKKTEKGDENAEDIAVEINKEGGDDVEAGKPNQPAPEQEKLVNGNEP